MINNGVIVYVIDKAGNIQYSEIRIQNSDKPTFSISGIDNQWTNTLNWSIGTNPSEGVLIYFATSEKNIEKWGNYTSAQKWDSTWKSEDLKKIIPEGENYIHFWAVFDDGLHDDNQETKQYKFDCTSPIEYEVELSEPRGNWWYRERILKSSTPIYDT